jgi:hypothetical protein
LTHKRFNMLGMMNSPKKIASLIVSKKLGEEGVESMPSDAISYGDEMDAVGRDLLDAIKRDDASAMVSAIKALVSMMESSEEEME